MPRFLSLSIFSLQASRIAAFTDFIPFFERESSLITLIPFSSKYLIKIPNWIDSEQLENCGQSPYFLSFQNDTIFY
jgi:hypothetical protein